MSIYNYLHKKNNRNFGILLSTVFLIIWVYNLYYEINYYTLIFLFLISVFVTIFKPNFFILFNFIWMGLGLVLALMFSNLLLILFYYFVFTPIAFLNRIIKKNFFNLAFKQRKSYWVKRENKFKPMRHQF